MANIMTARLIPILLAIVGILAAFYFSVFVAGFAESLYAPVATGSDDLDSFYKRVWLVSAVILSGLLSYLGFKLGRRLTSRIKR